MACLTTVAAARSGHPAQENTYWPGDRWRSSPPEAQGMDSVVLADALEYIRVHRTRIHSLMIVRNGYVVLDASFFPFQKDTLHDVASVTKSITSTLIGIVIGDGRIRDVKQPVLSVFDDRRVQHRDDRKEQLTLEDLLTMSSGLDCTYSGGERTLREMRASSDWVQFMLDRPMIATPGTKGEYCSGGMHLLSGVLTRATGTSALEYARQRLFERLGIREVAWPADSRGITHGWGDLHLRTDDMGKIGYLWLHGGRWKDQQIVPSAWMTAAIQPHAHVLQGEYGYGLWVNRQRDPLVFEANGRGGQRISVVPTRNLVVAITGGAFEPGDVGAFILKSIRSDAALAENLAAARRLDALIAAAALPPASNTATPLPVISRAISGKRYLLEDNPLGWRAVTFTFDHTDTAFARLEFADGRVEGRPLGLDAVPRLSPDGRFGLPVALQGSWEAPSTFVFDYDEVANINSFLCRFTFDQGNAVVQVKERSGEVDMTIRATGGR
ncbi:MAG: 6-aminohexanoate hydrolase [Acidobacteria bacterium]|nr:MAG: 6-aminohexanoate hydrolase [Acidobacteriota bacterium]